MDYLLNFAVEDWLTTRNRCYNFVIPRPPVSLIILIKPITTLPRCHVKRLNVYNILSYFYLSYHML